MTMATKFQKKQQTANEGFVEYGTVESFKVERVKSFDWGTTFDLVLNGVTIHGCKVAEAKNGDSFISFPSYKGRDGKYYSYIYFRFSEADQDEILKAVAEAL